MPYNLLAPIVLFVYNRPWHTQQTVEALQKNELATESELIIYSDGPKDKNIDSKVEEVRHYLKSIGGFKQVIIYERDRNYGLANNIIDGVTTVVNKYQRIIVLEDDLLTSPYFLRYANDGLLKYEHELSVISITGYIYPVEGQLPETFFLTGADCYGWATWKRGWDLFENDGKKLLQTLLDRRMTKEFDFNNSHPYTKMLKDQIVGKNNSWAIRWYASAFINNKLTLYPGRSLILNNGIDGSGVHSGVTKLLDVDISQTPVFVNDIELESSLSGSIAFREYFLRTKTTIWNRLKNKIKKNLS